MFSKATLAFLEELSSNNNREWFEVNKHRYESDVREPALAYIEQIGPRLQRISGSFTAVPKKVGGSLIRIHRDVRFGKDKTPYKTNIGIQLRHVAGKDVHAPGFYLHIDPTEVYLGAGIWRPDSQTVQQMRLHMDDNRSGWKKIVAGFAKRGFELGGDSLKRPPRGYPADHPLIDDLKRKDFIALCPLEADSIVRDDFAKYSAGLFAGMSPLVKFICEASDLEF